MRIWIGVLAVALALEAAAPAAALRQYLAQSRLRPGQNRLYYDRLDQTLDSLYPPYTDAIDAFMPPARLACGKRLVSRAFPGTAHNE